MLGVDLKVPLATAPSLDGLVSELVTHYKELWWSSAFGLPELGPVYSVKEQKAHEAHLRANLDRLGQELAQVSNERPDQAALEQRLLPLAGGILQTSFGLEERHIQALPSFGFTEAVAEFVRQARRFDPHISAADILQAGRNAWSMNLQQYLFGLPVEVTPSVLAYSLLYPYTDNYLDDPAIPVKEKAAFSYAFERRLLGLPVTPANPYEQKIFALVAMIEGQFERQRHPEVYASLMAILRAQGKSMQLQAPHASPYELDVLGLVFEKGGTAVLADAYLVAGSLTPFQKEFSFYYGAFTQLMDDLEDVQSDRQSGIMTVFSQTAGRWPLDTVTSRLMRFGDGLLDSLRCFDAAGLDTLEEIMRKCITPLLIDSASRIGNLYSRGYIKELERHSPYRFGQMKKVRREVSKRFSMEQIVEMILRAEDKASR
jgi:hypothetical protein